MKRTIHTITWEYDDTDWTTEMGGSTWRAIAGSDSTGRTRTFTLQRNGEFCRVPNKNPAWGPSFVQGSLRDLSRILWRVKYGMFTPVWADGLDIRATRVR